MAHVTRTHAQAIFQKSSSMHPATQPGLLPFWIVFFLSRSQDLSRFSFGVSPLMEQWTAKRCAP
jgi:hypothetical protein